MRRASILAALVNAILLLVAVGGIAWEALQRLGRTDAVAETSSWRSRAWAWWSTAPARCCFCRGRKQDINVRGAFLHMAADAGVSLGVVIAGFADRHAAAGRGSIRRSAWPSAL